MLNERSFLIRCLGAVFLFQFLTVGYLAHTCQTAVKGNLDSERITTVCSTAASSFNETGKLALATFLALLVPAPGLSLTASRQTKKPE